MGRSRRPCAGGAGDGGHVAFEEPVDIRLIVLAETGVQVTPENVPTSLEMETVMLMDSGLARAFFGDVLDVREDDNFGEYLIGEFQEKHGENLTTVELPSWHDDDDDGD